MPSIDIPRHREGNVGRPGMSSSTLCPIRSPARTSSAPPRKSSHHRGAHAWIVLLSAILGACATPMPAVSPQGGESARTIYVVRHAWHTGLIFRVADVPDQNWSVLRDFPEAQYLEVGWGDRDYYRAREPGVWLGIKALFWPAPGTLHVVGLRGAIEEFAAQSDLVELKLAPPAFERLYQRLRTSFDLDARGNAIMLGPGLYGDSRFYASRESFSVFKTCNVWTAQVLREAGVPVQPALAWPAGSLLRQLHPHRQGTAAPAQNEVPPGRSSQSRGGVRSARSEVADRPPPTSECVV